MASPKPADTLPRPPLWRLIWIQSLFWLVGAGLSLVLQIGHTVSIAAAGAIAILAQAYWIFRTLRGFGDPESAEFLAGSTAGLIGKWSIITVGLVLLWRSQLDISVAASVLTVFVLNTLAAVTAPIVISRPR